MQNGCRQAKKLRFWHESHTMLLGRDVVRSPIVCVCAVGSRYSQRAEVPVKAAKFADLRNAAARGQMYRRMWGGCLIGESSF